MMPNALPIGLPVAQQEGEQPGSKVVAPDPLWISRWQPSATIPLSKAPWIIAYRWYSAGVVYQTLGLMSSDRIELWFKDGHQHWYEVPRSLYEDFRRLTSSVGQWLHRNILGGWSPGTWNCRFPNGPL